MAIREFLELNYYFQELFVNEMLVQNHNLKIGSISFFDGTLKK
jgi:hypothetical protein